MKLPVLEQIARKIVARLESIQLGAIPGPGQEPYAITVREVVRPKRRNDFAPHDGVAVVRLAAFEGGEDEIAARGVKMFRTAVWEIDYFIEPPDEDPTPLDTLQAIAIAEIERALAEDFYLDASGTFAGPGGFAGIGHNAELRPPQLLADPTGATAGVRINLAVGYATVDRDPYTAIP